MPVGGCFCGQLRVNFTGEPEAHLLCHCSDCKKISGASYSDNLVIPEENFKLEGSPKTISKTADTGKQITSHFCSNCGTTIMRTGESFPGKVLVKAGVLDDWQWSNKNLPQGELFAPQRLDWCTPIKGAAQKNTMS